MLILINKIMKPDLNPLSVEPVRVFVDEAFALGEGPFWFHDRLWWVDINAGCLHSSDARGQDRTARCIGQCLGAAAPMDGQTFVVAVQEGLGLMDYSSGALTLLATPEVDSPENRFNDGKCDPAGRFLAGTLNLCGRPEAAALYSLGEARGCQKIFSPVTLSNGLAWSEDGKTFYHVDSLLRQITAFDYDLRCGSLSNPRVIVKVPESWGLPDGMDIDAEGNLWVAHWGGWAVRCWSPVTGECIGKISIPCSSPTSCCFGGEDGATLFITSSGDTKVAGEDPAFAGKIFSCRTSVKGNPARSFSF